MTCKRCGSETPENALYCPFCGKPINDTPRKGRRGNGQGNAYKRGKTWTGRRPGDNYIDEDGVQHRIRPTQGGFATKKEALAWACSAMEKEKPLPKLIDLWQGYSENDLLKLSAFDDLFKRRPWARCSLEHVVRRDGTGCVAGEMWYNVIPLADICAKGNKALVCRIGYRP